MGVDILGTIRKTILNVAIFAVLLVLGGAAYVYITDRHTKHASVAAPEQSQEVSPLPKPTLPAANAPEGAAVETLISPVAAGSNSSITIATNAGSACTIDVSYNGVKSTDSGLAPKTADIYGNVSWTWTVDAAAPAGSWPIKVTCAYHGRTGVVIDSLQVTE